MPRPIGWISTYGADGSPNLAPFSYFSALSASPMLVGVSIGERRGVPKDTLSNIRARGAFCVNVVTESLVEKMNATAASVGPEVDEFELVDLQAVRSGRVDAPLVRDCPAVLECVLDQEVDLGGAPNTLVIGRVVGLRTHEGLTFIPGTSEVDPERLQAVGRLSGDRYAMPGVIKVLPRPR